MLTNKFKALFADLPLELRNRLEASARVPCLHRCPLVVAAPASPGAFFVVTPDPR